MKRDYSGALLRDSSGVIDGSLLPCWSWADHPELYSGKHKTTGHNCQVVVDLGGRVVHLSDPVPPGSRGESHPPAPTDPDVSLSAHPALVVLITRPSGTTTSGRTKRGTRW